MLYQGDFGPKGHLAMSEKISGCQSWGGYYSHLVSRRHRYHKISYKAQESPPQQSIS